MSSITVFGDGANSVSWEQARGLVRSDLWRATSQGLPDEVIDRALHAALRRVESERRWSWLHEVSGELTVPSDGDNIEAPARVRSVVSLAFLSSARSYEILLASPLPSVRVGAHENRSGFPSRYALHRGRFYFDCPVQTGQKFELIFKDGIPFDLGQAIEDPSLTLSRESQMVVADACRHLALTRLKNETEAARHEAAYQARLAVCMDEEDETVGDMLGGSIQPDTAYHGSAIGYRNA